MSKYVLIFCLLLISATAFSQKKSIVLLIKSQSSTGIKLNGKDIIKVYHGTFKQDFSLLTSDSAYFYPQQNAFDAFGHVNINQGDTLNIYSDLLNYNGNTKIAILTNNVKMVDKDATLTTNHLTYNTATRIGTYTDGGKLVNKDNTLVSKNGYYFAFSRDAYFRYNVSLTTPDALVLTDTMRYNTKDRISYFYGPTNIYGKKNEKDKDKDRDTLYTENGTYNTVVEQGAFGKNNLYKSGTKSLKGDSLFYDKLKGYGRAVMHVTFEDKEQKTTIKGNLGTYTKADEHTIITQDPYVIMVTQDSTKSDSTTKVDSVRKADSVAKKASPGKTAVINMNQLIKKTIPGKTDTLTTKQQKQAARVVDTLMKQQDNLSRIVPVNLDSLNKIKNKVIMGADSALKRPASQQTANKPKPGTTKKPKGTVVAKTKAPPGSKEKLPEKLPVKDTSKIKTDSIYMSADTIETQIMTYKDLKVYFEKQERAHHRDTSAKGRRMQLIDAKFLKGYSAGIRPDTSYRQRDIFGKPKVKIVKKKPPTKKQLQLDSLNKKHLADSILMAKLAEPADTARIRIIIAYHNFKMFKSDLQAKSDSMFYSNSDSTIRCFVNPMMWTQGSQLSGDTIYMQMKHKKLDNMTMFPHAFIVNIEKTDSTHFNQVGGKKMYGYFKNDKLHHMLFAGNAESIYFSRDSGKMTISGMQRSLSSRITANFKNNAVTNMGFYSKPENRYGPLKKFTDEDKVLKGFIWKPKDRPVSKESIIPSFNKKKKTDADKKKAGTKAPPAKTKGGKGVAKNPGNIKAGKDSTQTSGKLPLLKMGKDSTKLDSTLKLPVLKPLLKTGKDSILKIDTAKILRPKAGKDSVKVKPPVTAPAPVKPGGVQ